jgi:hypothetical protein
MQGPEFKSQYNKNKNRILKNYYGIEKEQTLLCLLVSLSMVCSYVLLIFYWGNFFFFSFLVDFPSLVIFSSVFYLFIF